MQYTGKLIDSESDYLSICSGRVSHVDLSNALDNAISHDTCTSLLNLDLRQTKHVFQRSKRLIDATKSDNFGVLTMDNTIEAKPYMERNPTSNEIPQPN